MEFQKFVLKSHINAINWVLTPKRQAVVPKFFFFIILYLESYFWSFRAKIREKNVLFPKCPKGLSKTVPLERSLQLSFRSREVLKEYFGLVWAFQFFPVKNLKRNFDTFIFFVCFSLFYVLLCVFLSIKRFLDSID